MVQRDYGRRGKVDVARGEPRATFGTKVYPYRYGFADSFDLILIAVTSGSSP